jgi:hypothetical protein
MDELGKSFPASEGFVDAQEGTSKEPVNEFCLNCGTKLLDKFCHHCGQKDIPKRQSMGELFVNFLSSFFSYEGKFLQTTKYIITKPGYLAVEFNSGKRESYYHPARMYVFISFIFFLLFFSLPEYSDEEPSLKQTEMADSVNNLNVITGEEFLNKGGLDSILQNVPMDSSDRAEIKQARTTIGETKKKGNKKVGWSLSGSEYKNFAAYDSTQLTLPEEERDGWLARKLNYKGIEINQRYGDNMSEFGKDFVKSFKENFSKVLFFLLPIFALILKLLYVRRDYFYSEHLVFSIYSYNFFFLAGSLKMLFDLVPWLEWLGTILGFWIVFYLLFAMKKMYGQGWGKTILKFCIFFFVFSMVLGLGFGISALTIILFL